MSPADAVLPAVLDERIRQLVSYVKWGRTLSPNLGGVFAGLMVEYRAEAKTLLALRSRARRIARHAARTEAEDRAYEVERERLLEMQEEHPEMFDPDSGESFDPNLEGQPEFSGAFTRW